MAKDQRRVRASVSREGCRLFSPVCAHDKDMCPRACRAPGGRWRFPPPTGTEQRAVGDKEPPTLRGSSAPAKHGSWGRLAGLVSPSLWIEARWRMTVSLPLLSASELEGSLQSLVASFPPLMPPNPAYHWGGEAERPHSFSVWPSLGGHS